MYEPRLSVKQEVKCKKIPNSLPPARPSQLPFLISQTSNKVRAFFCAKMHNPFKNREYQLMDISNIQQKLTQILRTQEQQSEQINQLTSTVNLLMAQVTQMQNDQLMSGRTNSPSSLSSNRCHTLNQKYTCLSRHQSAPCDNHDREKSDKSEAPSRRSSSHPPVLSPRDTSERREHVE